MSQEDHYNNFLARIPTIEAFRAEIKGKLEAIRENSFPIGLDDDSHISLLVSLLPLDTIGKPQFWPPQDE